MSFTCPYRLNTAVKFLVAPDVVTFRVHPSESKEVKAASIRTAPELDSKRIHLSVTELLEWPVVVVAAL